MALIGEMRYLQIGGNTYEIPTSELPIASSSTLGGIKVGTNLSIDSSTGVLSVTGIPTKISDITTYDNFGIGYIDCSSSDRRIFVSNVKLGSSGDADYSSPFLLMFQNGNARYGTVTIPGSGNFRFYNINTNQLLNYNTYINYTNLQYGKLYIAYMNDNILVIKSIAETTDIPTIPTNISAFTNDAGYITSSDIPVTSVNGQTGAVTLSIPTISITRNLTSGTKSATINISGTDYDIYSETNTDTNVTQIPLNGRNSGKGLLFAYDTGVTVTNTVYTSSCIYYNDYGQTLYICNSDRTKYGYYKYDALCLANSTTSYTGLLKTAAVTASRTYTLPDATGTIALTSDIPSIPANVSAFTNDAGYITSSDIPVTSVNGQTGAVTVTDQNVTQTAAGTTTSAEYRLLLSNSTNDTTETNGVFKAGKLTYNPFYNRLILYPGTSDSGKLRIYYRDGFYFNLEPYGYSGDSSNYNAIVAFTSGNGKDVVLRGIRVPSNDNDAANKLYVDTHSLPTGGTAGQFLVKSSSTDYDAAWVTVPSANGVSF